MLNKLKSIAKDLLSNRRIRAAYNNFNRAVLTIGSSSRAAATVASAIGFVTFNREQYAVMRGRSRYYSSLEKQRRNHIGLRRNVHRLEKGMIMQPRRDVFALDYIEETIEFFEPAAAQQRSGGGEGMDASEFEWARDVLARYFGMITVANPVVDAARRRYEAAMRGLEAAPADDQKAPFERADSQVVELSYEQMMDLAMRRRSIRWFEQRPVPRELIDQAMLVARQAPSACNRLPYEYRFFDEPELTKRIAGIPFGSGGYSHQIPTVAVVIGKLDHYFSPRDRHAIYVDSSLSAMSFLFALETLGLSSTIINWPDFEPLEAKMQRTLGLDPSERVIMLIAIGYAQDKGGVPFSQKKDLDSIRSFNKLL
ncbi:MAG: nitroreductase family protein [Microbacteriaceae bacterium]|nr:nitroreductase family protein [Microbacteriaceae bacterium]